MTDDENKKRTDLFGDTVAKPLFGDDDAVPAGKPLFDNDFSDPGDAAFVKPLFGDDEEDEPLSLDDFQEFDNVPDSDDAEFEDDGVPEEEPVSGEIPAPEDVPVEEVPAELPVPEEVPAEEPVPEEAPASENVPADSNIFADSAVQETKPPFSDDMFGAEEDTLPEPTFTIPAQKVALTGELEAMSLGALMAYARETVGFTPENVYEGTKINEKFLFAIEKDQFDKLPSGAFPGAYVRALCSFYHLENNVCEIAQKKAAAYCTACRPPDEIYDGLPKHAVINKEEQEKFRRILILAGVLLLLLILMTVGMIMMFSSGSEAPSGSPAESPVKMEDLEKLSAPPQMSPVETLKVPGK